MIERATINGREATVAYYDSQFNPADKGAATFAKALFDDGEMLILTPQAQEASATPDTAAVNPAVIIRNLVTMRNLWKKNNGFPSGADRALFLKLLVGVFAATDSSFWAKVETAWEAYDQLKGRGGRDAEILHGIERRLSDKAGPEGRDPELLQNLRSQDASPAEAELLDELKRKEEADKRRKAAEEQANPPKTSPKKKPVPQGAEPEEGEMTEDAASTLMVPMVHRNGTSKDSLLEDYVDAMRAVRKALDAMRKVTPNGRDYYPIGDDALRTAMNQHHERLAKLESVRKALEFIAEAIDAQEG